MIDDLKRSVTAREEYCALLDAEEGLSGNVPKSTFVSSSFLTLGELLLDAALSATERRRLTRATGLSVLIEAPSAAWVAPLLRAVRARASWGHAEMRDGTPRHRRKPEDGEETLVEAMAGGMRVCVVCHAPAVHLPVSFLNALDLRVKVGQPTPDVVQEAIQRATGKRPRKGPATVAGLDFPELVAAIRGNSATACVRRIESASRAKAVGPTGLRDVPHIRDARGYAGAASEWATRLVEDLEDGSEEAWRDAERAAVIFGPPGTGKTSLAHIISRSTNLPLVETSVASWFEGSSYLEKVLARMVEAFGAARSKAPCVLFLDECEAFPSRDIADDRNASYYGPLQAAYLRELEITAAPGSRVVLIAATNHIRKVDPAVLRPGRLGRAIFVGPPDATALAGILRQHLGQDLADAELDGVAALGVGATGAEAAAWVRGARRRARVTRRPMEVGDLLAEAAPPDTRSDAARWRCAVHEAAHATVAHYCGGERVQRVSIVAKGRSGGHTLTFAEEDANAMSPATLEAVVASSLGGRAGEEAMGLGLSTGSHEDLRVATGLMAAARVSFGMAGSLVHRAPMGRAADLMGDPDLRAAVEADLARVYAVALGIVGRHRRLVEALARLLLEVRVVGGEDFLVLAEAHDRALAEEGGPGHG